MKIVMRFYLGDGYTFNCTETLPINYESCERAIVDFEDLCKQNKEFNFCDNSFYSHWFFEKEAYCSPDFLTVEEWFNIYANQ